MKYKLMRTAALLILPAVLVWTVASCGGSHLSGVNDARSIVGAPLAAPGQGRASTAPTIPLAGVLAQIDAYPVPKGVSAETWTMLTSELNKQLIARSKDEKTLSVAPTGVSNSVSDLAAVPNGAGTQATLTWTEVLKGDYNNDGSVDIADLAPMAQYYGEDITTGADDAHKLVDAGDGNPQVDIDDLQPIANNYSAHLEGYQVWRGSFNGTSTDWEPVFRPNVSNPSNTAFSADRTNAPPVSTRPAYTYTDDISGLTDKTNVRYKVTAYGDGSAGEDGNEAAMPPPAHNVSGTVLESSVGLADATVTLTPGGVSATTQADGTYTLVGVSDGTYTVVPRKLAYTFSPPTRTVVVAGVEVTATDFAAVGGQANPPWPKYHGDAQNTGLSPYVGAQTSAVRWTYATGNSIDSSPAIGSDGAVYVGSDDKNVYALNPADGSVKWSYATGDLVESSPAIGADGTVYIGSADNNIYALSPADGSLKWKYLTGGSVYSSPTIGADGTVYVGSDDKNVYALDPADGSVKWTCTMGGAVWSCPAIGPDGTIYVGSDKVYALNPSDGTVKWANATAESMSSPSIGQDGTVYVGGNDNKVYALNSADGSVKWTFATTSTIRSSPAIGADGTVYVGGEDKNVYALNPADGSVVWTYTAGGYVWTSPAVGADGTIYVGSYDGVISALDSVDGSVKWTYSTGGWFAYASPVIGADGTIYTGNDNGKVYAFGP